MAKRWGKGGSSDRFYFIFLQMVITAMKFPYSSLLGRKAMTNLDSVFKSRDITLPVKIHTVKATVFPGAKYGCKSWSKRKAE